jgi:O-antigen/teichoic acid export membrane protein
VIWFNVAWSGLLTLALTWLGRPLLDHVFQHVRFDPYLRVGTVWAALTAVAAVPLAVLQAQQRPAVYRLITGIGSLAGTAIAIALVVLWSWGALGSITGQAIGSAFTVLLLGAVVRRDVALQFSFDVLKRCLLFSLPLAVYAIGGWCMDQSNRLIIERYLTLQDLGLYGVAFQISQMIALVLTAIGTALVPLFYEQMKHANGARMLARFGLLYLAATITLVLAVTGFAHDIISVLTGAGYQSAWLLVAPLAVTQSLNAVWHLTMAPLLLRQRTGVLAVAMVSSAAASVGLSFWLVPRFGVAGAAFAPLGANLLLNALVFRVSIREFPVPYWFGGMARMIALGAAMGFVIHTYSESINWVTIAGRALLVVAYPAILVAMRIVPVGDIRRLWEALKPGAEKHYDEVTQFGGDA